MTIEIERKFLVPGPFPRPATGKLIEQGYLGRHPDRAIRVRRSGDRAWLTVKGRKEGPSAIELEYAIPTEDATLMLERLCEPGRIRKTRYEVEHAGHTWEIDVFAGDNEGLVIAEIELETVDEAFERPSWLGPEITEDPRYHNANLSARPYATWRDEGEPAPPPGAAQG